MPDAPHFFRTDRFVASRIRADDLQDFQSFYADPAVMSTMSADGRVWPATESSDLFDRHLADWEEHGFGTWVFRDPENGAFVARAGLCSLDIGPGPVVELLYGVSSGLWGRGVATERARGRCRLAVRRLSPLPPIPRPLSPLPPPPLLSPPLLPFLFFFFNILEF